MIGVGAVAGVGYAATGSGGSKAPSRSTPVAADAAATPAHKNADRGWTPSTLKPVRGEKRPPAKRKSPTKKKPSAPTGKGATYAAQVLSLVNAERAKHGCVALSVNTKLRAAAQGHSEDMVSRHFFDHTNPDGKGPGDRIAAAGYPRAAWGENIAYGQATPASVMDAWMHSPGHRANILNCAYRAIGVGVAFRSSSPYWTQDFGSVR
ncbi:CAP domain-containing protein [Actinomadura rupiterrae]|uniref:CAP domain-containing protein n=1 Tax=Actinomadura rupiterrae TaxID=559627 RepID=UPI0020A2C898|nr:CAP domain-containing protein [Actinomadura rupiterrae]MCP2342216.1 uncharacterized protein YkwD [Actinomadura rupiterrae]